MLEMYHSERTTQILNELENKIQFLSLIQYMDFQPQKICSETKAGITKMFPCMSIVYLS